MSEVIYAEMPVLILDELFHFLFMNVNMTTHLLGQLLLAGISLALLTDSQVAAQAFAAIARFVSYYACDPRTPICDLAQKLLDGIEMPVGTNEDLAENLSEVFSEVFSEYLPPDKIDSVIAELFNVVETMLVFSGAWLTEITRAALAVESTGIFNAYAGFVTLIYELTLRAAKTMANADFPKMVETTLAELTILLAPGLLYGSPSPSATDAF